MAHIAKLLHRRIRFQSVLNRRIFSLVQEENAYELVELENNDESPPVKRILYQGNDQLQVMHVIWKEVTYVS